MERATEPAFGFAASLPRRRHGRLADDTRPEAFSTEGVSRMAWEGSTRKQRLPSDWDGPIRRRILRRDNYECQVRLPNGRLCLETAIAVDHIIPGDDHRDENLRAICDPCHATKSGSEGGTSTSRKRAEIRNRFRRTEPHPGELY
jgi:5-methylcytosine-specific restriction protein A